MDDGRTTKSPASRKPPPRKGAKPRADFTVDQNWPSYTAEDHAIWRTLFKRQDEILRNRACREFVDGLVGLGVAAEGIPDFQRLNDVLDATTGWTIVAVPGLVPDAVFFEHLANRRFPSTCFIRRADQLDYLQEPDIFHDVFGHVPMLMNPMFADYMQAYGQGGLEALGLDSLHRLARLYWYTVEFGLIRTEAGLRIYGSGIVSSRGESIYSLEAPVPNRSASICGASCGPSTASTTSRRPTSSSTASISSSMRRGLTSHPTTPLCALRPISSQGRS